MTGKTCNQRTFDISWSRTCQKLTKVHCLAASRAAVLEARLLKNMSLLASADGASEKMDFFRGKRRTVSAARMHSRQLALWWKTRRTLDTAKRKGSPRYIRRSTSEVIAEVIERRQAKIDGSWRIECAQTQKMHKMFSRKINVCGEESLHSRCHKSLELKNSRFRVPRNWWSGSRVRGIRIWG